MKKQELFILGRSFGKTARIKQMVEEMSNRSTNPFADAIQQKIPPIGHMVTCSNIPPDNILMIADNCDKFDVITFPKLNKFSIDKHDLTNDQNKISIFLKGERII
jgi:hypothetical protein